MQGLTVIVFAAVVVCALGAPQTPFNGKVLGGTNAGVGEFPWMVSLRSGGRHFCGGSIINANTILTASHCVIGDSPSSITVVSGSNTLNSGGNSHRVSRIITHTDYNANDSWRNDVAVLQLADPIIFSNVERAVALPAQDENPGDNSDSTVSGWGYTSYPGGSLPNNLQKVGLKLTTNAYCDSMHSSNNVYAGHICAGTVNGEGVCNGDSGGPLVSNGKQVGIVSWGRPCAVGIPDVYTRVAAYATWIAQNSA